MDEMNTPHLAVFKRGKWYYVRYPKRMNRPPKTLHTADKVEAVRRSKLMEKELFDLEVRERIDRLLGRDTQPVRPAAPAYSDAARHYLDEKGTTLAPSTMATYTNTLTVFGEFLGKDVPITKVSIEYLYGYLRQRRGSKTKTFKTAPKDGTLRVEATHLKCFFKWCEERGLIERSPAYRFKLPKASYDEKRYLDHGEFRQLIKAIDDPRFKDIVLFYVMTGCRRCEGLQLRMSDIDLDQMVLKVTQKKTRDAKRIPLTPELWEILNRLKAGSKDPERFIPLDGDVLTKRFRKYIEKAKLSPRLTFHSLRHSAGTWAYASGHNMAMIQKFLGHKSSASTQRYANADAADLKGLMDNLTREVLDGGVQN